MASFNFFPLRIVCAFPTYVLVGNLVFYAQSTITVISGRLRVGRMGHRTGQNLYSRQQQKATKQLYAKTDELSGTQIQREKAATQNIT